jgi:hypothetical protein
VTQDVPSFITSGVIVLLLIACAAIANKLQPGARAMQALAVVVVVCAAVPMLVQWGSRGEVGGGLQVMFSLRMLVFVLTMNVDWIPSTVGLVVGVLGASAVVALRCVCADGPMLVIATCIACAAVLVERWLWCVGAHGPSLLCSRCCPTFAFFCESTL